MHIEKWHNTLNTPSQAKKHSKTLQKGLDIKWVKQKSESLWSGWSTTN